MQPKTAEGFHIFSTAVEKRALLLLGSQLPLMRAVTGYDEETVSVLGKLSLSQGQTFERKIWKLCKRMI